MTDPAVFPYVAQTQFVDIPETLLPGDVFEYEHHNSRVERALIAKVTPVSQVNTIQIGANNPGDLVGVTIDGGTVSVTAGANADATAILLEAALEDAAFLDVSVGVAADTVTLTFADDQAHTVVEFSPDATTATVLTPTAAVGQQQLVYGMGVARRLPITTTNNNCVVKPSSMSDAFAGILFRTHGTNLPPDQIEAAGFDPDYLCPGFNYSRAIANMGVVVTFVGTAPVVGDPVYWIKTGANAGLWSTSDGSVAGTSEVVTLTVTSDGGTVGVSQVSTLTMTSVADGDIGFSYDGLPALSIVATGNATNDATSLHALFLANASYMVLAGNDPSNVVDNLDGTLTITFAGDSALHTFADASTGTSTVAENIDVANVPFVAGGALSFNYDGLPDLSIAAGTGNATNDAATLYGQWIASAAYSALGSIVDNLDGTLTITFTDDMTHAFTDSSVAPSVIAENVDTPAVAGTPANAELRPNLSWAKPSVTTGDPTRAFLRLSNP